MNRTNILTLIDLRCVATAVAACLVLSTAHPADDLSRPIHTSPDGHFLAQPDGKPFFWLGDTAWELFYRLNRDETDRYLQDRARKGYNVVQAVATGRLDFEGLKSPNREGEVPFIKADPARPNERYFQHVDWVVDRAGHYGVRMALLPVWGGFFINGGPSQVFNSTNAETYGRWLARRFRGKGVIWVLGGDTNPLAFKDMKISEDDEGKTNFVIDHTVVDYRPVYDAMAKGIIEGDGGNPFITYHPTQSSPSGTATPRMTLYFGDRPWFDMSMLQSGQVTPDDGNFLSEGEFKGSFVWDPRFNYVAINEEYHASPPRPVIDGETRYEDIQNSTSKVESKGHWGPRDERNAVYHALFAGAAGHTYGHASLWDLYDPKNPGDLAVNGVYEGSKHDARASWLEALNAPGGGQMQYAKALMLSRPYFSRIPDQSLIVGDPGRGERHTSATRDRDGTYAMIYLPQGQRVTVDLPKIKGPRTVAWWFNPRDGVATKAAEPLDTARKTLFVPPTHGKDQDWVLVLDSEETHFSAPGGAT